MDMFVAGATARTAVALRGGNKVTASDSLHRVRQLLEAQSEPAGWLAGAIEIDESYGGKAQREARLRRPRAGAGLGAVKAGGQGVCGRHPQCEGPDLPPAQARKSPVGSPRLDGYVSPL